MKDTVLSKLDKVYSEENPSFFIKNLNNKKAIEKLINSRKNLLLNLKLPAKAFNNSKLLDLGCGSGQNSIVFDKLNAKCTLVEYNKNSFNNAKKIFKKFARKKHKFFNRNLFKFRTKEKFDFVVSNGVAHHTSNPEKNIDIACKLIKKNGFLILGICTPEGWFQRNFQRFILFNISNSENEIITYSKILFPDHLKRSSKFGLRSVESVIFDTYINPKINCVGIEKIEQILKKNKMKLYSSLNYDKLLEPFLNPEFNQHKQKLSSIKNFNQKKLNLSKVHEFSLGKNTIYYKQYLKYYSSLIARLAKVVKQFNDLNFERKKVPSEKNLTLLKKCLTEEPKVHLFDKEKNKIFINETINIMKILKLNISNKVKVKFLKKSLIKNKFLFKKYNGVGMNYFVAHKP